MSGGFARGGSGWVGGRRGGARRDWMGGWSVDEYVCMHDLERIKEQVELTTMRR